MGEQRLTLPNKAKLRNLVQYRDMTDEEFDVVFDKLKDNIDKSEDINLEDRIKETIDRLALDYDLSDMKSNDMVQVRALALAQLQLEDLELEAFKVRQDAVDGTTIQILEKLNRILSSLRDDITKISNDLQLTRQIRKQSKETTVIDAIKDLKTRAYKFYKQKMLYVFCPECKMLLATIWLQYPDTKTKITFTCKRCNNRFTQELSELYNTDNKNLDDVVLP